ncbi:MAG: hypothetical protein JW846_03285 [Dehalococcoidia bacterium]|nr:hypothetical protein [Dehalococcoidia bacterium]
MREGVGKAVRRRRTAFVGIVVMTSVVALSAMGMAFAYWADDVVVDAVVTTGNVEYGIYDYASWDPGPNYLEPGGAAFPVNSPFDGTIDNRVQMVARSAVARYFIPAGAAVILPALLPKVEPAIVTIPNLASTHSTNLEPWLFDLEDVKDMSFMPFYGRVREEFNNVYPWYLTGTTLVFGNGGTLPINVEGMDVLNVLDPSGALPFALVDHWDAVLWSEGSVADSWGDDYAFKTGPALEEFLATWLNSGPVQLEPGEALELGVAVYFVDVSGGTPMPEGANISLELEVIASLWCEVS